MLEKMQEGLEKNIGFSIDFSSKIDPKSSSKSRNTASAAKIDKRTLPGTAFLGQSRFFVFFWAPGGTPKLLKIYDPFPVKGSWKPSGDHFG